MDPSMENAFRFISAELKENPGVDRSALIDEASRRYDLNPMQTEFLINKYILEQ
jgi:hypothetical protein